MSTQKGVMKGTVTEEGAKEIKYLATHVGRAEPEEKFHVWGIMVDEQGEVPGAGESISFTLVNNDLPSGTYDVNSREVVSASYIIQPSGPVFEAENGYIKIERHPGEPLRINGLLHFRALANNGRHVDVHVVYEIEGIHVPPGRRNELQD
ncbi:hypothetical protein [Pseudomonas brassicacearum]|uniref:Uncharacterized protein n=1 Tax=Pseudomonas brassicacearum TaxID=930166 RepID=A0A423JWJ0_9PSED|nr:hypothetical protein [Pseudomonas brassicacearum]RON42047.1 hypothetical protein BK664_00175 [Pseudomonas brassicacearum]